MSPGGTYTHMTDQILTAGERAGWKEIEDAQQVRLTGGVHPDKQIELAAWLASEESNHISGRPGSRGRRLEKTPQIGRESGTVYASPHPACVNSS
jgi:hypothetical protein